MPANIPAHKSFAGMARSHRGTSIATANSDIAFFLAMSNCVLLDVPRCSERS